MDPKIAPLPVIYEFTPFRLDVLDGRLWCDDRAQPLRPKTFAMLAYLVARAGRLIEKRELLAAMWPGVVVEEAGLTVCVHELRQVLGDHRRRPRFIETQHRRGYRFIAPVVRVSIGNEDRKKTRKAVRSATIDSMPTTEASVGSCPEDAAQLPISAKVP